MLPLRRRLIPELQLLQSAEDEKAAFAYAMRETYRRTGYWLVYLIGIAITLGLRMCLEDRGDFAWWLREFLLVVGFGGMPVFCLFAFSRRIRVFVRKELLARGIPVCQACGYALRGLVLARCPECCEPFPEEWLLMAGAAPCPSVPRALQNEKMGVVIPHAGDE